MLRLFADKDLNRVMDIWLAGNLQAHPFVPEDYWRSQASRVREVINEAEVLVWEESGQIMGLLGLSVVSGGTDPETGQPEWVMRWTR